MKVVYAVLIVVGWALMALAVVCGFGYCFYLLGVAELTFGKAAWGGFLLWAQMFVGGAASLVVGGIGTAISK